MRELLEARALLARMHDHLMELSAKLPMQYFGLVDSGIIQDSDNLIARIAAAPEPDVELLPDAEYGFVARYKSLTADGKTKDEAMQELARVILAAFDSEPDTMDLEKVAEVAVGVWLTPYQAAAEAAWRDMIAAGEHGPKSQSKMIECLGEHFKAAMIAAASKPNKRVPRAMLEEVYRLGYSSAVEEGKWKISYDTIAEKFHVAIEDVE